MRMEGTLGRPAKLSGERVLVVEDEIFVSLLVEDELRGAGAEVMGPAPSVSDALRLIEAAVADGGGIGAAVLDINLDGQHVRPVADRLAALGVPFVFATGYGENCDKGGHGAAPILSKPFATERLVAAVAALASAGARCRRPASVARRRKRSGDRAGAMHPRASCGAVGAARPPA